MYKTTQIPNFDSIEELKQYLLVTLPSANKVLFSAGKGFNRSAELYRLLGDPQEKPKTIHIAGTSGKGSTAYYLSAILSSHGFKVGTHVSPHVYDVRESAMVDLSKIDEKKFIKAFTPILPRIYEMKQTEYGLPTYFEVLLGNAFNLFADLKVDYSVIETGLGGRYDSTNTIKRNDKLSVITRLGLDHTEVLGSTIDKIAYQKAGIINQKSEVIAVDQEKLGLDVVKQVAKQQKSTFIVAKTKSYVKNIHVSEGNIYFDYDDGKLKIDNCLLHSPANYQVENVTLAIRVFRHISERDGFRIDPVAVKQALKKVQIPSRFEVRKISGVNFILDGAHNPQKMKSFLASLQSMDLSHKPIWVVALKHNKDISGVLKIIIPFASQIICTDFFRSSENPFLRKFATSPDVIAENIKQINPKLPVYAVSNPSEAVKMALKLRSNDETVVVSGSLYLLSEINEYINV